MIESEELIQQVLSLVGETLVFDSGTIKGIPSFKTDRLYSQENTNYIIEQQDFNIQVSSKDMIVLDVSIDDTFTLADSNYTFTFKLNAQPIPYLDNWSRLPVDLIGKELL